MRYILLVVFFIFFIKVNSKNICISELRQLYIYAYDNIDSCNKLYSITNSFDDLNHPVEYSYNLTAQVFKSNHVINPIRKLSLFKDATKKLDQLVSDYPDFLEIRFLRCLIQFKAPRFLGYYDNFDNDYKIIIKNIYNESIELQEFILPILRNINK